MEAASRVNNLNKANDNFNDDFKDDSKWVKSALEKGVNPKIIATLGGNSAM